MSYHEIIPHKQALLYKLFIWAWYFGEMVFGYPSTRVTLGDLGYSSSIARRLHYRSMIRQKWTSYPSLICYLLIVISSSLTYNPAHLPPIYLALFAVITVFALVLRWSSIFVLGNSFELEIREDTVEKRSLVTNGPYRLCRHPGYCAMLLYGIGVVTTLNNVILTIITHIALSMVLVKRVREEELHLICEFGDEYRNFQASVTSPLGFPWLDMAYDVYKALMDGAKQA
eukprot:GHVH01007873.1.p1 GENE.GHVH01007873.1~~GHVH01007873.1.p1  ORF type:complete len:228 (+),score=10.57 GHVH01007873.1:109-792(+)